MRLRARRSARLGRLRSPCGGRFLLRARRKRRPRWLRVSRLRRRRAARRRHRDVCRGGYVARLGHHRLRRWWRFRRRPGSDDMRGHGGGLSARDAARWGDLPPPDRVSSRNAGEPRRVSDGGYRRKARRPTEGRSRRLERAGVRRRRRRGFAGAVPPPGAATRRFWHQSRTARAREHSTVRGHARSRLDARARTRAGRADGCFGSSPPCRGGRRPDRVLARHARRAAAQFGRGGERRGGRAEGKLRGRQSLAFEFVGKDASVYTLCRRPPSRQARPFVRGELRGQ